MKHGNCAPVDYPRHRPEQTTLHRLVQQHAQSFFAQTKETTGASLPKCVKDEFNAFLECASRRTDCLGGSCAKERCRPGPQCLAAARSRSIAVNTLPHRAYFAVNCALTGTPGFCVSGSKLASNAAGKRVSGARTSLGLAMAEDDPRRAIHDGWKACP